MSKLTPLAAALLLMTSGTLMANEQLAEIEQIGIDNIAQQTQSGTIHRSFIRQNGTANGALTDQSGDAGEGSQASIEQIGTYNAAEVYQVHASSSGLASAEISQSGDSNSAYIEQLQYLGDLAATASVRQEGSGNQLEARQTWVNNQLDVVSLGQDNTVHVDQTGFSMADIQQTGAQNLVQLQQLSAGIGGGTATVEQDGVANQANIYQTSGRYPAGDVMLQQSGTANLAQINTSDGHSLLNYAQRGAGNELTAHFSGHGSRIDGYSEGNDNQVAVSQVGDDNSLDIAQIGSDNLIDAYQGFHNHEALISQSGDGNQAILRQETLTYQGASASIVQNGSGNLASVVQQ